MKHTKKAIAAITLATGIVLTGCASEAERDEARDTIRGMTEGVGG